MVAVLGPSVMRLNGNVVALRMEVFSSKYVVNMVSLIDMMVQIECLVRLLAVLAAVLLVIKAMYSALAEKCDEVTELVST